MIIVNSLEDVVIDGVAAGDIVSAIANYPSRAQELRVALDAFIPSAPISSGDGALVDTLRAEITTLEARLDEALAEIKKYQIQNIDSLVEGLKNAGFYVFLSRAAQANPEALDAIADLRTALRVGDIQGLKDLFAEISMYSSPTSEEIQAWQGILDEAGISILSFRE